MANRMLIAIVFYALSLASPQIFAANDPALSKNVKPSLDECSFPAPDSFRVTNVGLNFISLAWKSAWIGVNHTVIISKKNALGEWEVQDTVKSIPDPFYTIEGLESGKYFKFTICAECVSGEPSMINLSLEEQSKVIDLVIAGRMPLNPTSILDCHNIDFQNNEWTGFRIDCFVEGGVLTNFFEFENYIGAGNKMSYGAELRIKRVIYDTGIFATNEDNNFPTNELPLVQTDGNKFKVSQFIDGSGFELGGYIRILFNYGTQTVDICALDNLGWNNKYSFTLLRASSTTRILPPDNGTRDEQSPKSKASNTVRVQSLIDHTLNIFDLHSICEGEATISLFGINGQNVFEHKSSSVPNHISLPVETIPSGLYFLRIDTNSGFQVFKVVKAE